MNGDELVDLDGLVERARREARAPHEPVIAAAARVAALTDEQARAEHVSPSYRAAMAKCVEVRQEMADGDEARAVARVRRG